MGLVGDNLERGAKLLVVLRQPLEHQLLVHDLKVGAILRTHAHTQRRRQAMPKANTIEPEKNKNKNKKELSHKRMG